jgi:hypothetical protein
MAKAAFIKKTLLTSKLNFSSGKKLVKCYIFGHRFVWCWKRMENNCWTDHVKIKYCTPSRRRGTFTYNKKEQG